MGDALRLRLGVKTDPIEYRYSFEWLFRIMAEEGARFVQIGTFVELYHLSETALLAIRRSAEEHGLTIASVFTAHRELGGFFRREPEWQKIARHSFERLIEAAAVLGASSVGSNPGAIMRDEMSHKPAGVRYYLDHMRELMAFAHEHGIARLTMEPMSCLAEPPTLPDEISGMMDDLLAHHASKPETTCDVGCCADVSHGYADEGGRVIYDHMQLLEAALPYATELHLKNTDAHYGSTFGFADKERRAGVVDVPSICRLLGSNADRLPVRELVGYLEIGGPKTGRDYSDRELEGHLRGSLRYLKEAFTL